MISQCPSLAYAYACIPTCWSFVEKTSVMQSRCTSRKQIVSNFYVFHRGRGEVETDFALPWNRKLRFASLSLFFVAWGWWWLFKCTLFYYRLQTKFAKVMFIHLSVILFTEGVSASVHAVIHTPGSRHPPWSRQPPGSRHPPAQCIAGRYGQQAGGMHPTWMHTCLF